MAEQLTLNGAPFHALSYPQQSWEELKEAFLGHPANLQGKPEGEHSMLEKRQTPTGRQGGAAARPASYGKG
jgi:hypothetical protein